MLALLNREIRLVYGKLISWIVIFIISIFMIIIGIDSDWQYRYGIAIYIFVMYSFYLGMNYEQERWDNKIIRSLPTRIEEIIISKYIIIPIYIIFSILYTGLMILISKYIFKELDILFLYRDMKIFPIKSIIIAIMQILIVFSIVNPILLYGNAEATNIISLLVIIGLHLLFKNIDLTGRYLLIGFIIGIIIYIMSMYFTIRWHKSDDR